MRLRTGLLLGVLLGWGLPLAADILYSVTDLGTLNGTILQGSNLNNAGQVVGSALMLRSLASRAFLYSNGQITDLGPGAAFGINDLGQVTGASGSTGHAFLYSNGQMQDLGTLGGSYSAGSGINNAGQVTGESSTSTGATHAFFYSNGQMQDLGTLGGSYS
ncbi:MAG: HAF repeat-containing protein, partial [Acidobacteriia bacterium]|nr:HAF repeat-containing protein [Terriglobia bacterium]